jgi:hypothetical protein
MICPKIRKLYFMNYLKKLQYFSLIRDIRVMNLWTDNRMSVSLQNYISFLYSLGTVRVGVGRRVSVSTTYVFVSLWTVHETLHVQYPCSERKRIAYYTKVDQNRG